MLSSFPSILPNGWTLQDDCWLLSKLYDGVSAADIARYSGRSSADVEARIAFLLREPVL